MALAPVKPIDKNTGEGVTLTQIAGLSKDNGNIIIGDGSKWTVQSGDNALSSLGVSSFALTLIDDTSASAARSTLGLGSMATQSTGSYASLSSSPTWTGSHTFSNGNTPVMTVNRTSDGTLVNFQSASTTEGSISVSGTTVSYNGAHLSRYSQLQGSGRPEILMGTVMANVDEMCVAEGSEVKNLHLNRVKISDVDADRNVTGVWEGWKTEEDGTRWDLSIAQAGDFYVRIGAGIDVAMGDLLTSAGDGTARPQDDDVVRSSTIAKVNCTHRIATYPDGSYTVPCNLLCA